MARHDQSTHRVLVQVAACVVLAIGVTFCVVTRSASAQVNPLIPASITQKALAHGRVPVIVHLTVPFMPEGNLRDYAAIASQRQLIFSAQSSVLSALSPYWYAIRHQYSAFPLLAIEVGVDGLNALGSLAGLVARVEEDMLSAPSLAESAPLVQAPTAWAAGFDGAGWVVAVLDTGVDRNHPFLAGKVVSEACYALGEDSAAGAGDCPNGLSSQTGSGAAAPCTYAPSGCRHGTHVTGIAAGNGSGAGVAYSGVGRAAQVIAVQVFSRFTASNCGTGEDPCARSWTSDQIAGLQQVYDLRTSFNIAAVNMSLGGGQFFSNCDANSVKVAIDSLRSVGIATVVASGNSGYTNALSSPACISTAVSVGSTEDGSPGTTVDTVSSFSNSASFLSLLAPGEVIDSSVPGNSYSGFVGTSMAAPHVAGAWAILKQASPSASVTTILSTLQATGVPITDSRNGITKRRIRIASALSSTPPPNDMFASAQIITAGTVSGTNVGATKEPTEPSHAGHAGGASVWYRWMAPDFGVATITTAGSSFNTLLAVYLGKSVGALALVQANDDFGGGQTSSVTFESSPGSLYHIAIDGLSGAMGDIRLELQFRPVNTAPGTFADVPSGFWAHDSIDALYRAGVTGGCSTAPLLYCPNSVVTREQMAVFLLRAKGEFNPPTPAFQRFLDVPPSSPFYRFIDRMAALGITGGCGGGNYCPHAPVTREQMAAFVIRALGEFSPPLPAVQRFLDVPPGNPFYAFIERMAVLGITVGCSNTHYCPFDAVTRAQMAVFLVRAFHL